MQDTKLLRSRPETRYIAKIGAEIDSAGDVESIRSSSIVEEQTHAAEILAVFTGRGVIPREYQLVNEQLVSDEGDLLSGVLDYGIVDAETQIVEGKLGAEKELRRRKLERTNLDKIMSMPVGFAAVEMSAADRTWTKEERKAQGYPDDTMVRITSRVNVADFKQLNIILQTSDLAIINNCRRLIEPGASDIDNAEEMLGSPQIIELSDSSNETLSNLIEAEYVRSTITFSAGSLAKSALGRVIIKRKVAKEMSRTNSWDYVVAQPDVFNALFDSFVAASMLDEVDWSNAAAIVRGGAWHKLVERYKGNDKTVGKVDPEELRLSANRAAVGGFVFSACGGTTDMKIVLGESSFIDRMFEAATLLHARAGRGSCASCGRSGELFGCGIFCHGCNKIWCEEYVLSGKQLEPKEIKHQVKREKYHRYARAA